MTLIDLPQRVSAEKYDQAIQRMCAAMAHRTGLIALFQIGHVSTPGISDLDVLAVFADDALDRSDPRDELPPDDRYLFTHSLFCVTARHYARARTLTFFHNYHPLWGTPPGLGDTPRLVKVEEELLKRQLALEYLVRIFVSLTVERTYGILKVRGLFLQVKALRYDCEFLGLTDHPFCQSVESIVHHREAFFTTGLDRHRLVSDVEGFYGSLHATLAQLLANDSLFLPSLPVHRLSRNLRLIRAPHLEVVHDGCPLPGWLGFLGRPYFNVQHRWNRFEFHVPFRTEAPSPPVAAAFALREELQNVNRARFPSYLALASSLILA